MKPTVSAGSYLTGRFEHDDPAAHLALNDTWRKEGRKHYFEWFFGTWQARAAKLGADDPVKAKYMLDVLAYCLHGSKIHEIYNIWTGLGGNGKSSYRAGRSR